MTIVLSVILWLRLLISPLVSFGHCVISHSLITSSHFTFGIFWPLNYSSFFDYVFWFSLWYLLTIVLLVILWLRLLISPLVSFGHCIVSHSLITSSNFPLSYLLAIVLSIILWLRLLISPLLSFDHWIISHSSITSSYFPFGIFWPLYYQSFFDYVF